MKKLSLIALMGASSLFMFSCKDDEVTATNEYEIPENFSKKTVEENKIQLEDNGIKMIREMETLKALKGPEVAAQLVNLWEMAGNKDIEGSAGGRIIKSAGMLRTSGKSARQVFSNMRISEDSESLQQLFNENAGTYSWVSATEEFDFVAGGDKIIMRFPSTEAGSSNNAVLTMSDYKGVQVSNPIEEDYAGDLPTKLLMNISVDGAKVMEYSFNAAYNDSGEPTSMNTTLSLAPFTFDIKMTNDTKKVAAEYSLKNGANLLMAFGASSDGNFASDHIENSIDDQWGDIAHTGSAYFQLMNIKVAGTVNVKDGFAAYQSIDGNLDEEKRTTKEVEVFNNNYKLVVYYADSKEKIADTEFYSYMATNYYWEDANGDGYWEEVERQSPEPGMRLVFADGTKSDFETYFETGFDSFIDNAEAFMEGK